MSQVIESRCRMPDTRQRLWAVAYQNLRGECYLVPVRLSSRDDGEVAFIRIRSRIKAVLSPCLPQRILLTLIAKRVAGTAVIRRVRNILMLL